MTSAFTSFPGTVLVQSFFMKKTWYVNCGITPSRFGLALRIQSVKWRTKSKKKSPSGTEMTLSAILTKSEKPSDERKLSREAMSWQKSLAWLMNELLMLRPYHLESIHCGISLSFYAGLLPPPPNVVDTVHFCIDETTNGMGNVIKC